MPSIIEKPTSDEKSTHQSEHLPSPRTPRKLLPISFLVISTVVLVVIASLQNVTKTDEDQLEALQGMIDKREPLKDYEKEAYCELLWKVKQVRLCACKKNFITDIGSLTGYTVRDSDLDWRGSQKTENE